MHVIRYARRRAGLTQHELAQRAAISQPALARIETGRVNPRIDTVERLLQACGMSLEVTPILGIGVDRSTIRRLLALTPRQRLDLAAREGRAIAALQATRKRR